MRDHCGSEHYLGAARPRLDLLLYRVMDCVAVIPARSGSKGLGQKNTLADAGKPMLAWTVESAVQAGVFSRVIVSTDDPAIGKVGREWGAEVPFLRPPELALDHTDNVEVLLHALGWLCEKDGYRPDYVMCLQLTSPLRTAVDIQAACDVAIQREADGVVSVCPVKEHPYWMRSITEDGRLVDFLSLGCEAPQRQGLPPVFVLNGAIYLGRCDVLLQHKIFYTERTFAYVMPPERSVDIDTARDLHEAETRLLERVSL